MNKGLMNLLATLVTVAAVAWVPAAAHAMPNPPDGARNKLRIAPFFSTAFGGSVHVDVDNFGSLGNTDLDPAVGFGASVDGVMLPYFGLGGLLRFQWVKADQADKRSTDVDFALFPRARYPFAHGEVYLGLPVGFSLQWVPDSSFGGGLANVNVKTGYGWNVALIAGGQYLITDRLGVFGHLGGMFRGAKQKVTGTAAGFSGSTHFKTKTKQFLMELGVSFLL